MMTIEVYDVECENHHEAGNMITFRCPVCRDEISVAAYGWWKTTCSCGYTWGANIYAYTDDGDKEDK
jgi:hypothetical protein